jgi:hypothetical protein
VGHQQAHAVVQGREQWTAEHATITRSAGVTALGDQAQDIVNDLSNLEAALKSRNTAAQGLSM